MQQYWGQLCEQYDEQKLGHMVYGWTFPIGVKNFVKNGDCPDEAGQQCAGHISSQ